MQNQDLPNQESKEPNQESKEPNQEPKEQNQEPKEPQEKSERIAKNFTLKLDKELKQIPDYVKVKRVKKSRHRASVFVKIMFGLIVVCLSVGLSITIIFSAQDVLGMGKPDVVQLFEVPKYASATQIADLLQEKGIINSSFLFKAYFKITKAETNFQNGTYSLNSNMSYDGILMELAKYSSSKEEVQILFKEGSTIYQIADLMQANKVCSASDFIKAIDETNFGFDFENKITDNEFRFHKLEGYLFPDTYKFFVKDSPINAAKKMLSNYDNRVSEKMLVGAPTVGLSQEDIMTIASIVQLEAIKEEDMKKVASVYLNRLRNPGEYAKLQADPTREYANELKLQMSVINQPVLDAYNTYEGTGLPPGPIGNPGMMAIDAVLNADKTDYFYFCTNIKTKEFYYAQTLKEHNKNVRKAGLRQNS